MSPRWSRAGGGSRSRRSSSWETRSIASASATARRARCRSRSPKRSTTRRRTSSRSRARPTITHEIVGVSDAARVVLRPASEGTGVIAGAGVRAVLELAGIRDVLAKNLGTTNPINMTRAAVNGLQSLRRPEDVARMRGKTITEVLPPRKASAEESVEPGAEAEPSRSHRPLSRPARKWPSERPGRSRRSAAPLVRRSGARGRFVRSASGASARCRSTRTPRSCVGWCARFAT